MSHGDYFLHVFTSQLETFGQVYAEDLSGLHDRIKHTMHVSFYEVPSREFNPQGRPKRSTDGHSSEGDSSYINAEAVDPDVGVFHQQHRRVDLLRLYVQFCAFRVCFVGVGCTVPPPSPHYSPPPTSLRMQSGSQLVSISITLVKSGRTGSCGQTHEGVRRYDWSRRLSHRSEQHWIISDLC